MKLKVTTGLVLTLFLIGMLTLAFNIQPVRASGTIYIRADGSVEPPTAPISSVDNVTYTFTEDIYDSIVVERDDIVVDGAGYTVQGTGAYLSKGIYLNYRNNVTLKNIEVTNFTYGIYLDHSSNNALTGNKALNNGIGIFLGWSSNNNVLVGNNASNNDDGVLLVLSSNNTLVGNNASNNGIGIYLDHSSNNALTGNTASSNNEYGIYLYYPSNNTLVGNNASNNDDGIYLVSSSNNTLVGNNASNNYRGIRLIFSSNNNVLVGNNASNNDDGIYLLNSSNNVLTDNIASSNNEYGIYLSLSSNNTLFHNNFIDNAQQMHSDRFSINTWDDGYPSGGNYWNDYTGVDVKSGPNQDRPSSDCVGDIPHVIDENNQDNYPLMYPWGAPPLPSYNFAIYSSPTGVTFTVDNVSRATPWSGTYSEGASVSVVMPGTHDRYVWFHWLEDGDINRIKTVTIDTNTTLTAVFAPDTTPPTISIISPENKTYLVNDVPLNFTVTESTSWIGYSLDGKMNVTISGNTTMVGLSEGTHSITVYANDTAGNTGASEIINFSIETKRAEPFLKLIVAAIVIIAVVGAALLVYFTKVKKTTERIK